MVLTESGAHTYVVWTTTAAVSSSSEVHILAANVADGTKMLFPATQALPDTLGQAFAYLQAMAGLSAGDPLLHPLGAHADRLTALALAAGAVGSLPWLPAVQRWHASLRAGGRPAGRVLHGSLELAGSALLLLAAIGSLMMLSADTYNPFIYFRF